MSSVPRGSFFAPFRVRGFALQWPADLLTNIGIEMEIDARETATYASLEAAGFQIGSERSRAEFAMEFFRRMRESGPSPLGLPVVMGENAALKVQNMIANIGAGAIAPVEMICRAV